MGPGTSVDMLSDSKSHIPKKSKRLAILREAIQKLVDKTPLKLRYIIRTFEEALHSPVPYSVKVSKANDKSRLT